MKLVTSSLALAFAIALVVTACATREVPVEVTRVVEQTVEVAKDLVEPDILIKAGVYKDYRTKYT